MATCWRCRVDELRVVLASSSPRRRELLERLGVSFTVDPPDIDESPLPGEAAIDYVGRIAAAKAGAVAPRHPDAVVIAADTTVDLDGCILAKPADAPAARRMLKALSGRTHRVHTGVVVGRSDQTERGTATTYVTFTPVTDSAIEWYISTGEPMDRAGAYAIQGHGNMFVEKVTGSVTNVVGLPLALVDALAARLGCRLH